MLNRSLTATSFDRFWQYWNPIFGYYLGRNVFAPLKGYLPSSIALILTFVFCGALHDAVTAAVRGDAAFLFTPWFLLMGILVVLSKRFSCSYAGVHRVGRVMINIALIAVCFYLATFVSI
ncbi:MAG: D-alanyl-lipoteichoic acid acyltransferase DltB (MBOAT superfamily) [Cryomorphaceae bacterium]|jgi:D-alanyl-lipoteichoic acid acyltransferase DltB (MBOAT superfamily)